MAKRNVWHVVEYRGLFEPGEAQRKGRSSPLPFVKLLTGAANEPQQQQHARKLQAIKAMKDGLAYLGVYSEVLRFTSNQSVALRGFVLTWGYRPPSWSEMAILLGIPDQTLLKKAFKALDQVQLMEQVAPPDFEKAVVKDVPAERFPAESGEEEQESGEKDEDASEESQDADAEQADSAADRPHSGEGRPQSGERPADDGHATVTDRPAAGEGRPQSGERPADDGHRTAGGRRAAGERPSSAGKPGGDCNRNRNGNGNRNKNGLSANGNGRQEQKQKQADSDRPPCAEGHGGDKNANGDGAEPPTPDRDGNTDPSRPPGDGDEDHHADQSGPPPPQRNPPPEAEKPMEPTEADPPQRGETDRSQLGVAGDPEQVAGVIFTMLYPTQTVIATQARRGGPGGTPRTPEHFRDGELGNFAACWDAVLHCGLPPGVVQQIYGKAKKRAVKVAKRRQPPRETNGALWRWQMNELMKATAPGKWAQVQGRARRARAVAAGDASVPPEAPP